MDLDAHRLLVLRAVASAGSVSGAAEALGYTQPAISHHLRVLERQAGIPLLARQGRGVRLTDAGVALTGRADALARELAAAQDDLDELRGVRAGRVRVVAFPSIAATRLPGALGELVTTHPGLDVELTEAEPPEALAALAAGEADVAVVFDYPTVDESTPRGLVQEELFEDALQAILPADHPLAGRVRVRLEELADERWIAGCERCRSHLLHAAEIAGFTPAIRFATDDYMAVQGLVAAGLGVALLPSLVVEHFLIDDVRAVAVRPAPRRRILVATGTERPSPATRAVLEILDRRLRQPVGRREPAAVAS